MAEIINIDEMIPPDIEMSYRGELYVIPGDLDTETVMKVFRTFRTLLEIAGGGETSVAKAQKAAVDLNDLLLEIFQIRNPALEELPFGARSTPIVVTELLRSLGVDLGAGEGDEEVPTTGPESPSPTTRSRSSAKVPATKK